MEMFPHHNFDRNLEQVVKLDIQCYIFWRTVIWVGANNKENKLFFYLQRCAVFSCHFKSSGLHFAAGKYFPIWITDHYSVAVLELNCILWLEVFVETLISCHLKILFYSWLFCVIWDHTKNMKYISKVNIWKCVNYIFEEVKGWKIIPNLKDCSVFCAHYRAFAESLCVESPGSQGWQVFQNSKVNMPDYPKTYWESSKI